jgi:hypothetical protein
VNEQHDAEREPEPEEAGLRIGSAAAPTGNHAGEGDDAKARRWAEWLDSSDDGWLHIL